MSRVESGKTLLRLFRPKTEAAARPRARGRLYEIFGEVKREDLIFAAAPCAFLSVCLAVLLVCDADVAVSRMFYQAETSAWPLANLEPFRSLYESGCLPAVCLGVAGLTIGLAALLTPRLRPMRRHGLFLGLALALGPGILVNGILKPSVSRPRPCQTDVFGGPCEYAYFSTGGTGVDAHSFPSGHASMGFFFMTPALLVYRRRPRLAAAFLFAGFCYGLLMGVARIAQGAHFATDVIGAALCVYAAAVTVLVGRRGLKRYLARRSRGGAPDPNRPQVLPLPVETTASRRSA